MQNWIEYVLAHHLNTQNLELAEQVIRASRAVYLDIDFAPYKCPLLLRVINCASLPLVRLVFDEFPNLRTDVEDSKGLRAVHYAAYHTNSAILKFLFEKGLKNCVNFTTRDLGLTPLHIACEVGCLENVTLLCEAEADLGKPRKDGKRALDIAIDRVFDMHRLYLIEEKIIADNGSTPYRMQQKQKAFDARIASMEILKKLLGFGAAIGRDCPLLFELAQIMSFENCYFFHTTINGSPVTNNLAGFELAIIDEMGLNDHHRTRRQEIMPSLNESEYASLSNDDLTQRLQIPYEQLILRCDELLGEAHSNKIRALKFYFSMKSEKITLQKLCLHVLASTNSASAENVLPKFEELSSQLTEVNPLKTQRREAIITIIRTRLRELSWYLNIARWDFIKDDFLFPPLMLGLNVPNLVAGMLKTIDAATPDCFSANQLNCDPANCTALHPTYNTFNSVADGKNNTIWCTPPNVPAAVFWSLLLLLVLPILVITGSILGRRYYVRWEVERKQNLADSYRAEDAIDNGVPNIPVPQNPTRDELKALERSYKERLKMLLEGDHPRHRQPQLLQWINDNNAPREGDHLRHRQPELLQLINNNNAPRGEETSDREEDYLLEDIKLQ